MKLIPKSEYNALRALERTAAAIAHSCVPNSDENMPLLREFWAAQVDLEKVRNCNEDYPDLPRDMGCCVDHEIWEGPDPNTGYMKHAGNKTIRRYTDEVLKAFRSITPDVHDSCVGHFEWFGINLSLEKNYHLHGGEHYHESDVIPDSAYMICHCGRGGSEGYIVHLDMVVVEEPTPGNKKRTKTIVNLMAGKCFDQRYAWLATMQLSQICGLI